MSKEYKTSYRAYAAWNYQKEIEDLNAASDQGWQLVKGGCFHSRFVKNPNLRYRYQLDYRKIEDLGRYIETFREQGWEYINSTFNGWHYFRKLYDPSAPEEEYEIFTDMESLQEMNGRWARLALAFGTILLLFAALFIVRLIRRPELPTFIQTLIFLFEGGVLLHGAAIMRSQNASRSSKNATLTFALFFAAIIVGLSAYMALLSNRPHMQTSQHAGTVDAPIVDNRWNEFKVKYPDNYYLDLEFNSEKPMTFSLLDAAGEIVYTQTGTAFKEDDIRLKLSRGTYCLSMSCEAGFDLKCEIG